MEVVYEPTGVIGEEGFELKVPCGYKIVLNHEEFEGWVKEIGLDKACEQAKEDIEKFLRTR